VGPSCGKFIFDAIRQYLFLCLLVCLYTFSLLYFASHQPIYTFYYTPLLLYSLNLFLQHSVAPFYVVFPPYYNELNFDIFHTS